MNQDIKNEWVTELRSNKFLQGNHKLHVTVVNYDYLELQ